ncbi:MAG: rRNA maturation RNase YbeY [Acidobacteriota bacterium]
MSPEKGIGLRVEIIRRKGTVCPSAPEVKEFVRRLAAEAGSMADEVAVVLTQDEEIRRFNRRFRGVDAATDVLSFQGTGLPDGRKSQGEIVISVQSARRQAAQRHHSLAEEIRYLLIHGFLHLMGFDHENDSGEMVREEYRLRDLLLNKRCGGSPTEDPRW